MLARPPGPGKRCGVPLAELSPYLDGMKTKPLAFAVHLLTGSGAALALMALIAATAGNWRQMFGWLVLALFGLCWLITLGMRAYRELAATSCALALVLGLASLPKSLDSMNSIWFPSARRT